MKVKALNVDFLEYRVKRVPERRNRGRNANPVRAPLETQKSASKNPNLTGKAKVSQIWFRPGLLSFFVRCSAPI